MISGGDIVAFLAALVAIVMFPFVLARSRVRRTRRRVDGAPEDLDAA